MPIPSGEWPQKPILADFACVACRGAGPVRVAIVTSQFLYLRCDRCAEIWSVPERRSLLNAPRLGRVVPIRQNLAERPTARQARRFTASRAPD